jgi:hypothetical protein
MGPGIGGQDLVGVPVIHLEPDDVSRIKCPVRIINENGGIR